MGLLPLAIWVVWVPIYLTEAPCLTGDVSLNFSPPPMPLAKALQPIVLPHGPHFIVLAPPSFPCVITTFALIPTQPIRASRAYELTIPSVHVESMSRSPLQHDTPYSSCGALFIHLLLGFHMLQLYYRIPIALRQEVQLAFKFPLNHII